MCLDPVDIEDIPAIGLVAHPHFAYFLKNICPPWPSDHVSLVAMGTNSQQASHGFESGSTEDPPCRGDDACVKSIEAQIPPFGE
ncbi:hypothetical protein TNCV_2486251 [Trichonephila clavipes]|uniref:Uncharacterized protein n=1 Tax=Trichonephila clavipes TaxID=2585209 RepID=A0A8X6VZP6_TRICX|nr:hypothetical protein TNCV_2486251 [Trichonephila clavipes]